MLFAGIKQINNLKNSEMINLRNLHPNDDALHRQAHEGILTII